MKQAIWNGEVIAESDSTVVIEGNHYFPADSVRWELLEASDKQTVCPWKGTASYYDIAVNGKTNSGAVWQYRKPSAAARGIKDHVAFWRGVRVVSARTGDEAPSETPGLLRRLFPGRSS